MTDRRVVSHLLRRVTFGPTAAEVDAAAGADLGMIVTALLAPAAPPRVPDLGPDPYAALAAGATRGQATDLDDGDLKYTTDFRDVYATLLGDVIDGDAGELLDGWKGRLDGVLI